VVITAFTIGICFLIRDHYRKVGEKLRDADHLFASHFKYTDLDNVNLLPIENNDQKTAVFFVTKHYGAGLHTLLWVQRMFPNVFKNFVFVTSGEINSEAFANEEVFKKKYRQNLHQIIEGYRYFCTMHDLPSAGYFSYGVNGLEELIKLSEQIQADYSDCVFFAGKLVFVDENWWTRILHNNTVNLIQRQLHLRGMQMVILPMKI
jgi:hypothetical protein